MKIKTLSLYPHEIHLKDERMHKGILIHLVDNEGNAGWGEASPLPGWSQETVEDAWQQLEQLKPTILSLHWASVNRLKDLELLPSVAFGLESALLSILKPFPEHRAHTSALLMGSVDAILRQAEERKQEGYEFAKLKVGSLKFDEAFHVVQQLKDVFRLRIDVNRAWTTPQALSFFSQFPLDAFDYVEEPFQNPADLSLFLHPLAVDESFISFEQLELLPALKAVIYKPTLRGGMLGCLPLQAWTGKRGVQLVLSSSFESSLGLAHIATIAERLSLPAPIGIGTHAFLKESSLKFSGPWVHLPNL